MPNYAKQLETLFIFNLAFLLAANYNFNALAIELSLLAMVKLFYKRE